MAGKVLLDDPEFIRKYLVEVHLKCLDPGKRDWFSRFYMKRTFRPDGEFLFQEVPAGPYRFSVTLSSTPEDPLFQAEGIQVEPGKILRDPRLQAIDLRGVLEWAELRVLDEKGELLAGSWVKEFSPWSEETEGGFTKGIFRFAVRRGGGGTCTVTAKGYRKKKIRYKAGVNLVRMERKASSPGRKRKG